MTRQEFEQPWKALKAAFRVGAKDADPGPYFDKFEYLSAPEWQALVKRAETVLINRPYANAFPSTLELQNIAAQRDTIPALDDKKREQREAALWEEATKKYNALDDDKKAFIKKLANTKASVMISKLSKILGHVPMQKIREDIIEGAEIITFMSRNKHLFNDGGVLSSFLADWKDAETVVERNGQ